mmetsp:Transcript_3988/g.6814  ORF Transcript_3988/g.6814 Transcript_3988/m.6814 type:complete len:82 (-) Transcript_3988:1924-2169(-)
MQAATESATMTPQMNENVLLKRIETVSFRTIKEYIPLNELKKLRLDLSEEADEEVKDELKSDIDGLKKKKDEWAIFLGIKE